MKRSTLGRVALPAAIVLTLGLSACSAGNEQSGGDGGGSDEQASGLSGSIAGAGASAQGAAIDAWVAGFGDANPDSTVTYDPVGSGGGRDQFLAGPAISFAGSDSYLDDDELEEAAARCEGGEVMELPNYISPIAVVYNLPGVDDLNLSPAVLAGLFDQQITTWDDPAIVADNPDADLPSTAVTAVNRADESGTTENFTEYLAAAAGDAWPHEPSGDWPVSGGEAAQQTSGVIQAVGAGEGTIGYADASQAGELGVANVQVGEEFVSYSPEAAAAVVEASPRVADRGQFDYAVDLDRDTTEAGTYPIVLISYHIACTVYEDEATADLVRGFLTYVVSEEGQQAAAENAGSAPISQANRTDAMAAIDAISAG